MDNASYQQHFQKLQNIAELLKQENVDIDKLIPMVEEAMQSYQYCKNRIDSVKEILQDKFGE